MGYSSLFKSQIIFTLQLQAGWQLDMTTTHLHKHVNKPQSLSHDILGATWKQTHLAKEQN